MIEHHIILIFSGFLFAIGFCGALLKSSNFIKVFISLEIMSLAGIINFCEASSFHGSTTGEMFAIVALIICGIIFSTTFAMHAVKRNGNDLLNDE